MRILFSILSVLLCLYSCSGGNSIIEEPTIEKPTNPKEYIVNLGFSGEITNIEESPLSRAVTNDLYGIQVYSKPSSGSEYKPYAYGLFDDKANINIKLLEGYNYKFECTMIVDGKNKIHNYNGGYSMPFSLSMGEVTVIQRAFIYSSSSYMNNIAYGASVEIGNSGVLYHSKTDRYYGQISDYNPVENGNVSINMKRVSFGLKVITEGLTEGRIKITLKDASDLYITYPNIEVQDIFAFQGTYGPDADWISDTYSETIPLSMSWEKSDGAVVPLVTKDITFKRNKLTTITVKVKDNSINNGVDVSQENTPMGDGGNITIDTSNGTDTGVTPNP